MRLLRLSRSAAYCRRTCVGTARPPPCLHSRSVRARGGVYVPSDSFGGQSPERKAAGILRTFFTFVAARVVLAQLEGSGRGALGAYDSSAAADLHHFLQDVPMRDGDEWLAQLMRKNTSLGLRLMEVRDSYCDEAFEWDQLQRLAKQDMKGANTQLMRRFATASLAASLEGEEGGGPPVNPLAGWRSAGDGGSAGTAVATAAAATTTTGSGSGGGGGGGASGGASARGTASTTAARDDGAAVIGRGAAAAAGDGDGGGGGGGEVVASSALSSAAGGDESAKPADGGGGGSGELDEGGGVAAVDVPPARVPLTEAPGGAADASTGEAPP